MHNLDHTAPAPVAPVQRLLVRRSAAQSALGWMPDNAFDAFLADNGIRLITIGRLRYVRWRELVEAVERLPGSHEGASQ